MWSDMGRPKCGKPLTLVLREMDVERQSDDKNLETLILHGCEHAEVIDYLIDHNIGKG